MNYGIIAAGGSGSRMGGRVPKQFQPLLGKPLILYSAEVFAASPVIDELMICCHRDWVEHCRELLSEAGIRAEVICGGESRNDTIMAAIDHIEQSHGLFPDTIIVTQDGARPFVTAKMIRENAAAAAKHGAAGTVAPLTDTLVKSLSMRAAEQRGQKHNNSKQSGLEDSQPEEAFVEAMPSRDVIFRMQTPQSFRAKELRELYRALDPQSRETLTDACGIYYSSGRPVALTEGDRRNVKITYPEDMAVAEALLRF